MEPAEAKVNRVVLTKIAEVFEKHKLVWISGFGKDALFQRVSQGWFVQFEGSYEAIHFGRENPQLKPGDAFKITFEKVQ